MIAAMSIRPINARMKPMSRRAAIGPFHCRHNQAGIRCSFFLERHDLHPSDPFWRTRRDRGLEWARGVVETAMEALWAGPSPKLAFTANGYWWKIVKLRVKAGRSE